MAKIYQAEIQVIADDGKSAEEVQRDLESALSRLKIMDTYVREVNYFGNIEEEPFIVNE